MIFSSFPRLLKISEACAALRVHRNTLRAMMADGRVTAVNLNPQGKRPSWRVNLGGLEREDPETELKMLDIRRRAGL
jgi:hypothetical protein